MKRFLLFGLGSLIVIGIASYVWFINAPRGMILEAVRDVPIYRSENEARSPSAKPVGIVEAGQSIPVQYCYYTKDFMIVQVADPASGQSGYVLEGDYHLLRKGEKVLC